MTKIILLVGRKGSGKDTVATMLLPYLANARLLSFAGPIKETLVQLFGFPDLSYFNDQDKKEKLWPAYCKTHTPRDLMIWFGTDIIRKTFGPTFWVDRLKNEVRNGSAETVIVTDARFPNEVTEMVGEFGPQVTTVYIDSCDRIGQIDMATATTPELAVIETRDMLKSSASVQTINNNGTPVELEASVATLVQNYINKIHFR